MPLRGLLIHYTTLCIVFCVKYIFAHFNTDTALYVFIAMTAFLLTRHLPDPMELVVGTLNIGAMAWKAKRSLGKGQPVKADAPAEPAVEPPAFTPKPGS